LTYGGNVDELGSFDGINKWKNLVDKVTYSTRKKMLYNINPINEDKATTPRSVEARYYNCV
jgi:hypothetical protein